MVATNILASSTTIAQWDPIINNFNLNSDDPAGDVFVASGTSYVVRNLDGTFTRITGVGFTYNANVPITGTISLIEHASASVGGTVFATINGFVAANNSAAITGGFLLAQDVDGLGGYLFSQDDTVTTTDADGTDWSGAAGNDSMTGGTGSDVFDGGDGNDTLIGGQGADQLNGSNGFDVLIGGGGTDTLSGEVGDDNLRGLGGNDTIDGGVGIDEVRYDQDAASGGLGAVNVNLAAGTATDGFGNIDTLVSVENVRGTSGADTLTGGNIASDGFEGYRGLAGNDSITGGTGFDEVRYDQDANFIGGGNAVTVNLDAQTAVDGFGNTDQLSGIEGARGTAGADTLIGSAGNNTFTGLAGADSITGGDGFDEVRYDVDLNFGGGAAVTVNLQTGTATDGFGNADILVGIQGVRGTGGADNFTGSNFVGFFGDGFLGLAGNDTISG